MKYLPLVWANLLRHRWRSLLTFLSIVSAFLLFGLLHGVSTGFDATIDALSDSRLRVQNRMSWTRWQPLSQLAEIERVPGVTAVGIYAFFGGYYQDPGNPVSAGAVDPARLFKVYPDLDLPPEQREAMLNTRTGALVGADLAKKYGWKIGDHIPLGTPIWQRVDGEPWAVDIVGIYRFKNRALPANELWMHADYFNEGRTALRNMVSLYLVAIDNPAHAARISHDIDALFRNSSNPTLTQSEKEWVGARLRRIGNVRLVVDTILVAVLFTLLALTANTMMQAVRERIPELAVLKTLGYSEAVINGMVVAESLLLCVGAAICGLALAALVFPRVFETVGVGATPIPPSVPIVGLLIAVGVALVSSAPPLWKSSRLDVVAALAAR
ncbi:MAG: FtsX-like permease family protein [Steroidobacteraceae bacterium]|nr:FtsX-like permease family protein [Steroidobacteraceae bacterium]